MSVKAGVIAALVLVVVAFMVLMFELQVLVGRAYGLGWELALTPVEILGCVALGCLIGREAAR